MPRRRRGLDHLTARVEQVETLQLDAASLDGAFARWLFCFLPDPTPVIERVVSGLRPGGRLVVWDYLNYRATTLQPPSAAFERVLAAVDESWRRTGGDLNVGGRLPGLIASAGCRALDLVPLLRFARPGTPLWEWPTGFFIQSRATAGRGRIVDGGGPPRVRGRVDERQVAGGGKTDWTRRSTVQH